jgi:hypothetical protein
MDFWRLTDTANRVAMLEAVAYGWSTLAAMHPREAAQAQAALDAARQELRALVSGPDGVYQRWRRQYAPGVGYG